jgi:glycerophosphoryl diester phosphodiesterase
LPSVTTVGYDDNGDFVEWIPDEGNLTKDCVLAARHNPWLSDNTNIAEVAKTNAAVAARTRTVPGVLVKVKWAQFSNQRAGYAASSSLGV